MRAEDFKITVSEPSLGPWKPRKSPDGQIAVLMSGGVDSSTTACLLKEKGWEVLGITMKIPPLNDTNGRDYCGADAASVCRQLDIPHYVVDVTEPFKELIIKRFLQSYAKGETPNPCVDCNMMLKFSLVWNFIENNFGIDRLATGHYARVYQNDNQWYLGMAKDKTKDQSYFLYGISPSKLPRLTLPLGDFTKNEVRSMAAELKLDVADKSESMELCFAGQGDYRSVLKCAEAQMPGDITDMQGNKIAIHKGIANYTLGQRQGIGFAGGIPLYVAKINAETNTIALGTREDVCSRRINAEKINILIPEEFVADRLFFGKIRSYGTPQPCRLIDLKDNEMTVEFDRPQFAPCPGQKIVLYNNADNIVAGGTITT
ncbi:MAG: tRNA 2-thiouridine(34) synthase MnmA [Sedimentisphaerales bacterium]|nr:tRNA 2-thiouridine(34) synthase MnmA [Sedimentisphaerales bacterium]